MAKKGKKLTRKERKAAKEGENITKKPTDEAEKASKKSPDETEKPVETNDESENDKILHPVDIAHDVRHFINEIAGSEKTLQEEYNTEVEFLKSGKSDRQECIPIPFSSGPIRTNFDAKTCRKCQEKPRP